jgi:hypothetical protein
MAKIWFGKWKENQPICLPFYKLFILCHKASQFHETVKLVLRFFYQDGIPLISIETKHCGFPDRQYG